MHRPKPCLNHDSSSAVQTIERMLQAKDVISEGHSSRLQDLVGRMAAATGISGGRLVNLKLLARFHDVGKVYVSDSILLKPGPLNAEEAYRMQRHCEFGYRIALSTPVLSPIAEHILMHHEWWNGQGYPLGLKEGEIPLECRMLAVADAYDAMTNDRPYRKAMPHSEALDELRSWAGIQFDPQLTKVFLKIVDIYNRNAACWKI